MRKSGPVLLLDNGDVNKGYGRQPELKYETAMKAMAEMGYAAANVGEQDLLLGLDYLKYVSDFTGVPLISANMTDRAGGPIFQQYALTQPVAARPDLTVAVVGIISPDFKKDIESLNPDIVVEEYDFMLEELIENLRAKSHLLILLAHAGEDEADELARRFPEIDLIIASHIGDDPMPVPLLAGNVPIVFAGTKGMHVGVAKIGLGTERAALDSYAAEKLDGEIEDSPRVLPLLADYQQMLMAEKLLESYPRIVHEQAEFVGGKACRRCHSLSSYRFADDKHAHGFDSLTEKGHGHDPECVGCHSVGFGYESGFISPDATPELQHVGCESCHGPGAKHVEKPMDPEYGEVAQETCERCHNPENSPNFVYEERIEKIRHNSFFPCSARVCHWLD